MATKPDRKHGAVGDRVLIEGRVYVKQKSGMWSLEITKSLLRKIKKLYVEQSKTLREVSKELDIPHSHVQKICNEQKWMRSHYGVKQEGLGLAVRKKRKILNLYHDGHTIPEISVTLGLRQFAVRQVVKASIPEIYTKSSSKIRSNTYKRQRNAGKFSKRHNRSWNYWITYTEPSCYRDYVVAVRKLTSLVKHRFRDSGIIKDYDLLGKEDCYHLDHRFAIHSGYYLWSKTKKCFVERRRPIPVKVLSHPCNLEVLHGYSNCSKSNQNSITLKELKANIKKFNSTYGNPFLKCKDETSLVPASRKDLKRLTFKTKSRLKFKD